MTIFSINHKKLIGSVLVRPVKTYLLMKAKTHGWPFVVFWAHRIAGVILVLYVLFHTYTLSGLNIPESFDAKMKLFQFFPFLIMEWLLAIPVVLHALNGGRLILYEIFGNRKDQAMLKWILILSALYLFLLGLFMAIGNQEISPLFFWSYMTVASGCITYVTVSKIRSSGTSVFWKLQRVTGVFLFLMIPGHMLFMHLNPMIGHNSAAVVARMGNVFIKTVDLLLIISVYYHGGYGLLSICRDYIQSGRFQYGLSVLIGVVMVIFAWIGVKLILFI